MVLLHRYDYPIKLPQVAAFGGKLGFCNTGNGYWVYRNGNYGMRVCRNPGICMIF